jgi:transposase
VTRPDRYEPWLNPVYEQLADHYSASVLPARVRKPRDKAKVEAAVKVASRWIIAALRHQRALSFGLLRDAVRPLTTRLNDRIMRTLGRSRRELFEHSERQALLALPATRYEWTQWARFTVGTDYHVLFEDHAYSVPHRFIGETLDIRATTTTVEILDGRSRVACHARARTVGGKTTLPDHRPVSHQAHAEWTLERVKLSAAAIGPQAALFVDALLQRKAHPEQGLRASLGLVRLAGTYPPARVESACARGLRLRALTLGSIRSILSHGLDREAPGEDRGPLPSHENIRGPDYYK